MNGTGINAINHQETLADIRHVGQSLYEKALRAGAVLRLMQFRFQHGQRLADGEENDISALVDVCLETMPHHDTDTSDPLGEIHTQVGRAIKAEKEHSDRLQTVRNAMLVIGKANASLEALSKAASAVLSVAELDDSYRQDWKAVKEILKTRGLSVHIEGIKGKVTWAEVRDAAARKEKRRIEKRAREFASIILSQR